MRFSPRAATSSIRSPTAVLPVKEIMSTSGEATSASPISGPAPDTRLTTPGGNAEATMRVSSMTPIGSIGGGLTTTVFPQASAGAILPAQFVIGKLKGLMQATTPTGSRTTNPEATVAGPPATPARSSGGRPCSTGAVARSAYFASRCTTSATCSRSAMGRRAPVSATVRSTRPGIALRNLSAASRRQAPRSAPVIERQGPCSKARRAARAAAATCAVEHSGARPATSSVAGFTMS